MREQALKVCSAKRNFLTPWACGNVPGQRAMTNALPLDGLTPRSLQSSRKNWWDAIFSRLLFDAIPLDTKRIVEVDCGLGAAAHALLPSLPDATYFGTDFNPERLSEAKQELEQAVIAPRVELRLAPAEALPLEDRSCDVFLSIMSLQHKENVMAVLAEAVRVLVPRGRILAVEPDNLGQRFYFDGGLEEISNAFYSLCLRARVARQPSDIALGPRLPKLLGKAGFHQIQMICHMVNSTRHETAGAYFARLQRIAQGIAEDAGLELQCEHMQECDQAIKRALFADFPKRVGYSCHIVPVFLSVGRNP
jgi:SAM-dependent methyltransferase